VGLQAGSARRKKTGRKGASDTQCSPDHNRDWSATMARRKIATITVADEKPEKISRYLDHPLVGYTLRAYGAVDPSLTGPMGTVEAVFPTADTSIGNLAMVRLNNGGIVLLPLTALADPLDVWQWVVIASNERG